MTTGKEMVLMPNTAMRMRSKQRRLPVGPVCPVTGRAVDPKLGLVLLKYTREDGEEIRIRVGAIDQKAMDQVLADPAYYGSLALDDYLLAQERATKPRLNALEAKMATTEFAA